jgi:hypothetical protein
MANITESHLKTYLNSTSCNMTIMGETSSEGRSIIESILWFSLCHLKLTFESVDLIPILKNFLFLLWEVWPFRHYKLKIGKLQRNKNKLAYL